MRHVHGKERDNTPTLSIERVRYAKGQPQAAELIERQHFGDPRWSDKPTRIERPSVVAGLMHSLALRYNAAGQINELTERGSEPLNHHPSGNPTPSRADELLTQTLKSALALVDVRVLDHVIVTRTKVLSLAGEGLL